MRNLRITPPIIAGFLALSWSPLGFGEASANTPPTGVAKGQVVVQHRGKRVNARVVVYLEKVRDVARRRAGRRKVSQKMRRFRPEFLVVTKGTEVEFPNDDIRTHNVYSNSSGNRFDLGEYRPGKSKTVLFKRPGVVDVRCNIHPDMGATVLVVDNHFWAESDRRGRWILRNVPPGTYELVFWVPYRPRKTVEITVRPGQVTEIPRITLEEGELPPRVRKDGRPHDYYRR